jgi:ABC-type thiamine transport system ATPase subunit
VVAGKTTVANLLMRFIDPEEGRITLGGKDLRSYRRADIRRVIALAGQDSYLFSASIRENVLIGRPGATDRELEDALAGAGILDWASGLADGWDTKVGEEGRAVSGGQRQRIAIARALITRAPVLVLDEPTAHLDGPTAERLLHDVLTATRDRSVLLITTGRKGRPRGRRYVLPELRVALWMIRHSFVRVSDTGHGRPGQINSDHELVSDTCSSYECVRRSDEVSDTCSSRACRGAGEVSDPNRAKRSTGRRRASRARRSGRARSTTPLASQSASVTGADANRPRWQRTPAARHPPPATDRERRSGLAPRHRTR